MMDNLQMRRADRLFQIVQIIRRDKVVTAHRLSEELEVSERTIYREMAERYRDDTG